MGSPMRLDRRGETASKTCLNCGAAFYPRKTMRQIYCKSEACELDIRRRLVRESQKRRLAKRREAVRTTPATCKCCGASFFRNTRQVVYCGGKECNTLRGKKKWRVEYKKMVVARLEERRKSNRVCWQCGKKIPPDRRKSARFCGEKCQATFNEEDKARTLPPSYLRSCLGVDVPEDLMRLKRAHLLLIRAIREVP